MRMTHKIGKVQQQKLGINVNVSNTENEARQSDQSPVINIKQEVFDSSITDSLTNSNTKPQDEIQAGKSRKSKDDETVFRKCKLCFKSIKKTNYTRHLKETHSGKLTRKCPLCNCGFNRKEQLVFHFDKIHKEKDLHFLDEKKNPKFSQTDCNVKCRGCKEKFISEVSMKYHSNKIHGHGSHQCGKCQKRFTNKSNLEKHVRACSRKVLFP